jgi:neuroblastoma-amplified sequence
LKDEYAPPHETPKETSDRSDGWMDGTIGGRIWGGPKEKKDGVSSSVHPLHSCWMEIIRKLVGLMEAVQKVIELLDPASSKHIVLLENDEAVFDMTIAIFQVLDC